VPAKDDLDPASRRARLLAWFEEHPGFHRCRDVAADLGDETHPIAVTARILMLRGDIERFHAPPAKPGGRPVTLYGINAATRTTTHEKEHATT